VTKIFPAPEKTTLGNAIDVVAMQEEFPKIIVEALELGKLDRSLVMQIIH